MIDYTIPKTLELNGMAVKLNKTIMEKVRCILSHVKLSNTSWVEAMMSVVYIINRSSSMPLDGDVPHRAWTWKDVSYRRLRVFGCLTYVHVAKDQRSKLDNKSRPHIFFRVR